MPEQVPFIIKSFFEKHLPQSAKQQNQNSTQPQSRLEYSHLLQSVFEAIAALLGVPQIRKVNLLHEKSYWESELVQEAKDAFNLIFNEVSRNGVMDNLEITQYLERVNGNANQKANAVTMRTMLDRFGNNLDGKLYLEGFLLYQADVASYNPKQVWKELNAFGFRNDLSRVVSSHGQTRSHDSVAAIHSNTNELGSNVDHDGRNHSDNSSQEEVSNESSLESVTDNCRTCLLNISFYEVGLISCEPATRAIAQRICCKNVDVSNHLIQQVCLILSVPSCSYFNLFLSSRHWGSYIPLLRITRGAIIQLR
jgi:hypothetical protein